MSLFEHIANVNLNLTQWLPVVSQDKCNSLRARSRAGEDWRISHNADGTAWYTVAGAETFDYDFSVPEQGIMFYVRADTAADILEIIFE